MESGGVSKIQGSVSCTIGEGGVAIQTGILDGPTGVAATYIGRVIFHGCLLIYVSSGYYSLPLSPNTNVDFTQVLKFI